MFGLKCMKSTIDDLNVVSDTQIENKCENMGYGFEPKTHKLKLNSQQGKMKISQLLKSHGHGCQ